MTLLLDTSPFLWFIDDSRQRRPKAKPCWRLTLHWRHSVGNACDTHANADLMAQAVSTPASQGSEKRGGSTTPGLPGRHHGAYKPAGSFSQGDAQHPLAERRLEMARWAHRAAVQVAVTPAIAPRAQALTARGFRPSPEECARADVAALRARPEETCQHAMASVFGQHTACQERLT